MNETIGGKGRHNDFRRTIKIKQKEKKKLEQEQEQELEKAVKRKQKKVFIQVISFVIAGETLKVLFKNGKQQKNSNTKWEIISEPKQVKKEKEDKSLPSLKEQMEEQSNPKEEKSVVIIPFFPKKKEKDYQPTIIEQKKEERNLPKEEDHKIENRFFSTQEKEGTPSLEKIKSNKIIEEYEKELKEIRYELRHLIFDYEEIVEEKEKIKVKKDAEVLLDKLSYIIEKIEKWKGKIPIDNQNQLEDNYIYSLITEYLNDFKNGKIIEEMKDSPLYVELSKKIQELEGKKDFIKKEIEEKQEIIEKKEEQLKSLKEKYQSIEKMNKDLEDFQKEQEYLLKQVEEKVKNAMTITEKVEIEVQAMNNQAKKLLNLLTLTLLASGKKPAKLLAAYTAAYLLFSKQIVNKTTKKKYQVISVKDYSEEIRNNTREIDNTIVLLQRTSKEVEKMIGEIKREFYDYIDVIPECKELLQNLEKTKRSIQEKEYEMERMERMQKIELEKNNQKILKKGEYPVN